MTTIHTGNTTTTGFVVDADNTGNLIIKTGGAGGTTALTIDNSQTATFAQPPLTGAPAFFVRRTLTDQTVSNNVATKVLYDTVEYDTNSWWDAVNYRYTPQIAGYYLISMSTGGVQSTTTNPGRLQTVIRVNNSDVARTGYGVFYLNANIITNGTALIYLNGSTDYLEGFATITGAGTLSVWGISNPTSTLLQGILVRAA